MWTPDASSGAPTSHILQNLSDMTGDFGDEDVLVIMAATNDVNGVTPRKYHVMALPGQLRFINRHQQTQFPKTLVHKMDSISTVWASVSSVQESATSYAMMLRSGKMTHLPTSVQEHATSFGPSLQPVVSHSSFRQRSGAVMVEIQWPTTTSGKTFTLPYDTYAEAIKAT
ncbi:hypothetical protein J6590_008639 [Homalodisca vitripennis]|nr:hypothetical protein J6590_008639 [Homalodisca vitripennis]